MMSKYNVQNGSDEIEQRIKKIEWDNSKTKSKPEIHTIFLGEEMVGQIINKLKEWVNEFTSWEVHCPKL